MDFNCKCAWLFKTKYRLCKTYNIGSVKSNSFAKKVGLVKVQLHGQGL